MGNVLDAAADAFPEDHPASAYVRGVAGLSACRAGQAERGEGLLREALAWRLANLPEGHWAAASSHNALGDCLLAQGRLDEAEALLVPSLETLREARGEDHVLTRIARERLDALAAARRGGD